MSVCLSAVVSRELRVQTSAHFGRVTRGPPLAALRYVMYFRFYEWRYICNGPHVDTAAASDVTASSVQAKAPAASNQLCRVLDDGGLRH